MENLYCNRIGTVLGLVLVLDVEVVQVESVQWFGPSVKMNKFVSLQNLGSVWIRTNSLSKQGIRYQTECDI